MEKPSPKRRLIPLLRSFCLFSIGQPLLPACHDSDPPSETPALRSTALSTVPTDERVPPGTGFNVADAVLRARCLAGESSHVEYGRSEVLYQTDATADELLKTLSGSASFSVKVGRVRASASTDFATSAASSKRTISVVIIARYETGREVLDTDTAELLADPGLLGLSEFSELCGDEVVTETVQGGLIAVSVVIRAETEAVAEKIRAAVSARAWKVRTAAEIFRSLSETKGNFTVEIKGTQIGGDSNQLGRIIGGEGEDSAIAIRDCSGGDVIDACQTVLAEAIAYAASPERAIEMARKPVTLEVVSTPWKYVGAAVDLAASPQVIIARGRLNYLASINLNCIKDDPVLSLHCRTINAAVLEAAGKLCFDKGAGPEVEDDCIEASQLEWLTEQGFQLPVERARPESFRDDFAELRGSEWKYQFTPGAASVGIDADAQALVLQTIPNTGCATASVWGSRSYSLADGNIVFSASGLRAYVDQGIYGDAQPRGLANGTDRSNAIEFVSAYPVPNHVTARTVANGKVTETTVTIGHSVYEAADYRIEAAPEKVEFFIEDELVATHSTNIPSTPLNAYFSTGDSCAGNVPVVIDAVSLEGTPAK